MIRLAAAIALLLLAACAERPAPPPPAPAAAASFDQARSEALVAEAAAQSEPTAALARYREAGLAWPANRAAWAGLAEAAREAGDAQEAAAAAFMVERLELYPPEDLLTQRLVGAALRRYDDADNPRAAAYVAALADLYQTLLAERGTYDPPRNLLNVELRELPAAILTGGLGIGYAITTFGEQAP